MTMKILCLHGNGQSGKVFQTQLTTVAAIIRQEDPDATFDYPDGPFQIQVSGQVPNRNVQYDFSLETDVDLKKAHGWLENKISTDGPYDGVIGFAEGGTLAASYLLRKIRHRDDDKSPFKFAIFFSASVSASVLKYLNAPAAVRVVEETELRHQTNLGPTAEHIAQKRQALFNSDDCFGLNLNKVPREFRLRIPTVHVCGLKDPCFPAHFHLAVLCDTYLRQIYEHPNGHVVPQTKEEYGELDPLIVLCIRKSK
ncbi:serine hydrolase FSH [Xylaria nigripes]|nr:serine hydrolase FSH [Xylaria nigripes]